MKIVCTGIFLMFLLSVKAQDEYTSILDRRVNVNFVDEPVQSILFSVAQQANFFVSYSPDDFSINEKASISYENEKVKNIFDNLFENNVTYKEMGKYLILQSIDKNTITDKKDIVVEGYLYDSKTGESLTQATVYNRDKMLSAITDEYGYFMLEIPSSKELTELRISKQGYEATQIHPIGGKTSIVNIELNSIEIEKTDNNHTHIQKNIALAKHFIRDELLVNSKNITDTIFRHVQFSVLPGFGTNKLLGGNTVNDFSINMPMGYVKGVNKLEIGLISNNVREDAGVVQLAGISNYVGGTSHGFQGAGIINYSNILEGVQAAGIINIANENAKNAQVAGVINIAAGKMTGIQAAGIININRAIEGVQAAGIINLSDTIYGAQAAGIINVCDTICGLQTAGIINVASKLKGVQISRFVNSAKIVEGFQISAGINKASYVKGYQIGLINLSDTCKGVPVGLFSFVKSGYHKLEFFADEVFYTNIAFRTGVKQFYTIFQAGIKPEKWEDKIWTFGFGLGTSFNGSNNFSYEIDYMMQPVLMKNYFNYFNNLNKLSIGADYSIAPRVSLYFGVSYNAFLSDPKSEHYNEVFNGIMPYALSNDDVFNDKNIKTWIGIKLALRFF